jgi:hypothetical protein
MSWKFQARENVGVEILQRNVTIVLWKQPTTSVSVQGLSAPIQLVVCRTLVPPSGHYMYYSRCLYIFCCLCNLYIIKLL